MYYHFKLFCETDNKWEAVVNETGIAPTVCPIDPSHIIREGSVAIDKTIDNSVKEVKVAEAPPFAQATYRTKIDAVPDVVTAPIDMVTNIDLLLTEDKCIYGGMINILNAEMGDYFTAEITDIDGLIPEPDRVAAAEDYPTVARYIIKQFIPIRSTVGQFVEIDTRPLVAAIPAGFYLRVCYHATAEGVSRKITINYYLAKKL